MTKAKELAREIHYEIDLATFCQHQSNIDKVYELCRAVLSEPDEPCGLKGFIEYTSATTGKRALSCLYFNVVYVEESEDMVMRYGDESRIELSMTFDQLKQKIKEAS